jgi:hypothetical protein
MRRAAILLPLVASLACAAEGTDIEQTLTLPHPLPSGASAFLEVQVGPLAAGQRVRVTTSSGEPLGTVSAFGPAARQSGGVYLLPVPSDAIHNGALSVRVTILDGNKPPRAPNPAEVQSLKVMTQDAAKQR